MNEIKETCYKGTRILLGNEKRDLINKMIKILKEDGFQEIQIPIIQYQELFKGKVGEENNNMMYNFRDRGNRDLCLAPEYTAVIQQLANTTFKNQKDVKLFYIAECFRGEKPQAGRYRQFTQFGVEILNPTKNCSGYLENLSLELCCLAKPYSLGNISIFQQTMNVKRGLDYYKEGKGFEITCEKLGTQKQVCGGGEYQGGVGFAIGIDRLLQLL